MQKPLLTIENLHAGVEGKEILRGVNLTIGAGETHVLMGPNGTGKSTLGCAITGSPAYTVTAGCILFDGEDITQLPVNERARRGIFCPSRTRWRSPASPSAPSSARRWSKRPAAACACGTSRKS